MELKVDDNPKALDVCVNAIGKAEWNLTAATLKKKMPLKYAREIKQLRVGNGPDDPNTYSWRCISEVFYKKHPEFCEENNIVSGNQISGMFLCNAAMLKLKESLNEGWN